MKAENRVEYDSIGMMEVPSDVYYGIQSLRAKENFEITGKKVHPCFNKNLAKIKKAAAITNRNCKALDIDVADAVVKACDEVIRGEFEEEFIVDAIQGGAGTSANMNMNEVLANRAGELLGGKKGDYTKVHPNDHVNMAQSTNDVIPTAGKMTVLDLMKPLCRELKRLKKELREKAKEYDDVIKMGRTQLQDAVPMFLGKTFGAYASMVARDEERLMHAGGEMCSVNLGGTAIGSAVNTTDSYLGHVVSNLAKVSGYPLKQAEDLYDATGNIDAFVYVSSTVKACALNLSKMCNDLRLLSSGPRTGLGEINLPARQNGSSIMPGKVNPVIPEVVNQVAFRIAGNDTTIAMAAEAGQMELNAFEPVVFTSLFESINMLTAAVGTLIDHCITGITVNRERCLDLVNQSVGIATALCPYIGYAQSAEVAKTALKTGKTVKEVALERNLMDEELLDEILNPAGMAQPAERSAARMSA